MSEESRVSEESRELKDSSNSGSVVAVVLRWSLDLFISWNEASSSACCFINC